MLLFLHMLAQMWSQPVGVAHHAEVCEMYPVHEGFVVVAHHVVRLEVPDVFLPLLLQFAEEFPLGSMLFIHF